MGILKKITVVKGQPLPNNNPVHPSRREQNRQRAENSRLRKAKEKAKTITYYCPICGKRLRADRKPRKCPKGHPL